MSNYFLVCTDKSQGLNLLKVFFNFYAKESFELGAGVFGVWTGFTGGWGVWLFLGLFCVTSSPPLGTFWEGGGDGG